MYQIAHILERAHSVELAKNATLKMQAEPLCNSLLSSISHDLRNPLAALVGAAYIKITPLICKNCIKQLAKLI